MKNKVLPLLLFLVFSGLFFSCLNQNRDVRQQWLEFTELDQQQQYIFWQDDLQYFAKKLLSKHKNPFHAISEDEFTSQLSLVEERFSDLDNLQRYGEILKLTALLQDGHSRVENSFPMYRFPFELKEFKEGFFIVSADREYTSLLGNQILMIGNRPIKDILPLLKPYISASNKVELRNKQVHVLSNMDFLYLADIVETPKQAAITFLTEDETLITRLIPSSLNYDSDEVSLLEKEEGKDSSFIDGLSIPYKLDYLEDLDTVIFQYNQCREMESHPMEEVVEQIRKWEGERNPRFFIIDLRYNGGGDSRVLKPLIDYLEEESSLNRRGRLFTAIGRKTYSSAILNAVELDQRTQSIYIGEPTGGKPNHYGEVKSFLLPNTGLRIFYSSKYFHMVDRSMDYLEPQIPLEYPIEDYRNGIDPLLELIREQAGQNEE